MSPELNDRLAQLLRERSSAALGTLRGAAPYVSMVPFAPAAEGFVLHVSTLAAHTKDMFADGRVSLLVAESEDGGKSALALMRVSVQGLAQRIPADAKDYPALKAAFIARFPDSEPMFGFADFSIFLIRPSSARFVAGFGQAHSLSGESLTRLLQQA